MLEGRRRRARAWAPALAAAGLGAACSGAPPAPVVAPAVVEAPKPPPVRAHWVFRPGRRAVKAQMPLANGARLYVGMEGLRQVVKSSGESTEAPTVGLDDFLGIMKDDAGQLLFLAVNGDTFPATDPLGALGPPRPGPLRAPRSKCDPSEGDECPGSQDEHFHWVTTGRRAMFGVTRDKRVLRSADFGGSWTEVTGVGSGWGRPHAIELDPEGNGLLLRFPQRLFVTHDDGATWLPMATLGVGAIEVRRDGDDRVWLIGGRELARLEGGALVSSRATPAALVRPGARSPDDGRPKHAARTLLCGDRVVEIAELGGYNHDESRVISFAAAPLGDKAAKPVEHDKLVGEGLSPLVACNGAEMVYLRVDNDPEASTRTSTVFRSHDYGTTWTEDGKLGGNAAREVSESDVVVGPDGFTYVNELCPGPDESECHHRQVRPAKAAAFEDMAFTEEFAPRVFAFDREHDRVYVAGVHNSVLMLYESPLTQNHFARVKILSTMSYAHLAMTVDAAGTLRVLTRDDPNRSWALDRRPFGSEPLPTLHVPLADGLVSFAGERGLLFSERGDGWETADGGGTWTRTKRVSTNSLSCSNAGCIDDDGGVRVGWDLPALTDGDVVTALSEPPGPSSRSGDVPSTQAPPAPPAAPRPELACKPVGAATTLASQPGQEFIDSRGEVRWAMMKRDADGRMAVTFATKTAVRDAELFGPAPKPQHPPATPDPNRPDVLVITGDKVMTEGVVAVRYHITTLKAVRQPMDLEVTWWDATTGKVHRHDLHKVPWFSTPNYNSFTGTAHLVDGGLLYQTTAASDVYFLKDDGGVETFSPPGSSRLPTAERLGKGWVLLDGTGANANLWWSQPGNKLWLQRSWGIEQNGRTQLTVLDGKPALAYGPRQAPEALFPLDATPTADPPVPVVVKAGATDAACTRASAATLRDVSYLSYNERRARPLFHGDKSDASTARYQNDYRITHVAPDGSLCTAATIFSRANPKTNEGGETVYLYPEAKGASGWWFRRGTETREKGKRAILAVPLICEPETPASAPKR